MIRDFYRTILDRAPLPEEIDAWETGYFEYALSFDIDVRFIPREMARLFFLSAEYAARGRTDVEFLTDCYLVFLKRGPSSAELDAWLGGEWNRAQVMTLFSESEEFAGRVAATYPGMAGDATRNFVVAMYVGLLDRLVDEGGLAYFAGVFDDAFAASGMEGLRVEAKTMGRTVVASDEYASKQPTAETDVVRLYRAYLGRFPSDSETQYWSAELASGAESVDSLIDLFAAAPEFTARLEAFFDGSGS